MINLTRFASQINKLQTAYDPRFERITKRYRLYYEIQKGQISPKADSFITDWQLVNGAWVAYDKPFHRAAPRLVGPLCLPDDPACLKDPSNYYSRLSHALVPGHGFTVTCERSYLQD
jgi:hypothetical protein